MYNAKFDTASDIWANETQISFEEVDAVSLPHYSVGSKMMNSASLKGDNTMMNNINWENMTTNEMAFEELDAMCTSSSSVFPRVKAFFETLLDRVDVTDCIASILISVFGLFYTDRLQKKWNFNKHNKFVNFIITGSTSHDQLNILAPMIKAYNIFCILITAPITIGAIIKKLRK